MACRAPVIKSLGSLRRRVLAISLMGAVVAAACGDDAGTSSPDRTDSEQPEVDDAIEGPDLATAIAAMDLESLSSMVLPLEAWGSTGEGFVVRSSSSGFQDNDARAEGSIDPDDSGEDFAARGRVGGYELVYTDPAALQLLEAGLGVMTVGSEVHLFDDAASAETELERLAGQFSDFVGRDIDDSVVAAWDEFPVDDLGDEAGGGVARIDVPLLELSITSPGIGFRVGRLVGVVFLEQLEQEVDTDLLIETARSLLERMEAVAVGSIDEPPVPIPPGPGEATPQPTPDPPEGVPPLSSLALGLPDLPDGFVMEGEGYAPPPEIGFFRNFAVDPGVAVPIGSTQAVFVRTTILLFESAAVAGEGFADLERTLTDPRAQRSLRDLFVVEFGDTVELTPVEVIDDAELADAAIAFTATADTVAGDFQWTQAFIRADRAGAIVEVRTIADGHRFDDLIPLLQRQAESLTDGLAAF